MQTLFVVLKVRFNIIQSVEYNCCGLLKISFKSELINLWNKGFFSKYKAVLEQPHSGGCVEICVCLPPASHRMHGGYGEVTVQQKWEVKEMKWKRESSVCRKKRESVKTFWMNVVWKGLGPGRENTFPCVILYVVREMDSCLFMKSCKYHIFSVLIRKTWLLSAAVLGYLDTSLFWTQRWIAVAVFACKWPYSHIVWICCRAL